MSNISVARSDISNRFKRWSKVIEKYLAKGYIKEQEVRTAQNTADQLRILSKLLEPKND